MMTFHLICWLWGVVEDLVVFLTQKSLPSAWQFKALQTIKLSALHLLVPLSLLPTRLFHSKQVWAPYTRRRLLRIISLCSYVSVAGRILSLRILRKKCFLRCINFESGTLGILPAKRCRRWRSLLCRWRWFWWRRGDWSVALGRTGSEVVFVGLVHEHRNNLKCEFFMRKCFLFQKRRVHNEGVVSDDA